MKTTRTLIAAAISAMLTFPLAACGTATEQSTDAQTADTQSEDASASTETKAEEKVEDKTKEPQADEAAQEEENILLSDAEWPDNEVAALVPKPEFSTPIESVDVSDYGTISSVRAKWEGVTQAEVAAYVQALKDAGFNIDPSESSGESHYSYSAYNADTRDTSITSYANVHVSFDVIQPAQSTDGSTEPRAPRNMLDISITRSIMP